jgi:hypothetical protein
MLLLLTSASAAAATFPSSKLPGPSAITQSDVACEQMQERWWSKAERFVWQAACDGAVAIPAREVDELF